MFRQAFTVCSNDILLQEELYHTETCFTEINGHPKWPRNKHLIFFKTNNKNYNNNINNKNNNEHK